jgi:salicylate hydroxylase
MAGEKKPFHIAIIGSGIGGLALAIGLLRHNVSFTVYESAAAYSVIGAGVGLGPNALRAMDMLEPKLRALYDNIATGNITPGKDHVIFDTLLAKPGFGIDEAWGDSIGAPVYERTSAHRKDLLDIMTTLIPIESVRFGKKAVSIKQSPAKVQITFADGEVVEADAVVGADGGNRGVSRPAVLGDRYPDEVSTTYTGKYVYRSIVPMEDAEAILGKDMAGDSKIFLGPVRHFLSYPISHGKQANVIAFVFEDKEWAENQWTKEVTREEMIADFKGHVDDRLIKLLDVSVRSEVRNSRTTS